MLLEVKSLSKSYVTDQDSGEPTATRVLDCVDLAIEAGLSLGLLGESGAGKSTLLHLLAGLEPMDGGEIWFDGHALHNCSESNWAALRRHSMGLVFQQFHLIETLSVLDNIRFQAHLCGQLDRQYESVLVDRLGLAQQLKKRPAELSRGQQQRVAIARALLGRPKLLLADEPTGSLDESASEAVMEVFVDLVKSSGCSLLMVTHSETMAGYLDRRFRLHRGKLDPCD